MVTMVIGTAGSGKSALAEDLAIRTGDAPRCYLATMKVCDAASAERATRHREQRKDKGFVTIEREYDLPGILKDMEGLDGAVILLECVSNLVANELFDNPARSRKQAETEQAFSERLAEEVSQDIAALASVAQDLIAVTNTYQADGSGYDEETRRYVRLLDLVNDRLMQMADAVYDLRDRTWSARSEPQRENFARRKTVEDLTMDSGILLTVQRDPDAAD